MDTAKGCVRCLNRIRIARTCSCTGTRTRRTRNSTESSPTSCRESARSSRSSLRGIPTIRYAVRFGVQKSRASTARIAMWKELAISAVYTIEASFLGPSSPVSSQSQTLEWNRRSSFPGGRPDEHREEHVPGHQHLRQDVPLRVAQDGQGSFAAPSPVG